MNRSPSSSGLLPLPLPGAPSSSWAAYRARIASMFAGTDGRVVVAFWLFGLINNILYVLVLSAAQDLVGSSVPKGVVLLADVMPSFLTKLVAPYFIHRVPYAVRILAFFALSTVGMLVVSFAPGGTLDEVGPDGVSGGTFGVVVKLFGIVLASLSSGGGELSFLGLTHYYGHASLAAWGSGTGGAGLIGAGLYVFLTSVLGLSVRGSLLVSAVLPTVMLVAFFGVLPKGPLMGRNKGYEAVADMEEEEEGGERDDRFDDIPAGAAASGLLAPGPSVAATAYEHTHHHGHHHRGSKGSSSSSSSSSFWANVRRAKALFIPYMVPLLLVYVAEYTINQGVAPTLLFPLDESPFGEYRAFYPFYGFLYQLGVFISRSSTPFIRIHNLYLPSLLQVANLVLLTLHALFNFIPSVYLVFLVVFWEGLLGGAVYVNTFAEIMERVPPEDREFSLGATSVSDSGGICVAGFVGMALEVWLCRWQVSHGREYCMMIEVG
ncbi:hypothetical protein VTJ83DRAFT_6937 [Remersonia thermophila]|uniref:Protein BTN n=1 Tax=Remersonia thermophila TaxID=72144 RepID=A0ABR4D637_9PEZI